MIAVAGNGFVVFWWVAFASRWLLLMGGALFSSNAIAFTQTDGDQCVFRFRMTCLFWASSSHLGRWLPLHRRAYMHLLTSTFIYIHPGSNTSSSCSCSSRSRSRGRARSTGHPERWQRISEDSAAADANSENETRHQQQQKSLRTRMPRENV